jgi:hypothetical protein
LLSSSTVASLGLFIPIGLHGASANFNAASTGESPYPRCDSSMNAKSFMLPSTVLLAVVLIVTSTMAASSALTTVSCCQR